MAPKDSAPSIKRRWLFDPSTTPAKGMLSALSPSSLAPGFFSQLTNVRFSDLDLYVRPGCAKLTPSGIANTTAQRGAWQGFLNGTEYIIAAYDNSSSGKCNVYKLDLSTFVWTEITQAAGRFGDTRLTSGHECSFAVVHDPIYNDDQLVIANGVDAPRLYDPQSAAITIIVNPIPLSSPAQATVTFQIPNTGTGNTHTTGGVASGTQGWWFQGYTASASGTGGGPYTYNGFTITNSSSTHMEIAPVGGGLYYTAIWDGTLGTQLNITGSVVNGDNVKMDLTTGTGVPLNQLSQISIWNNGTYNPWQFMKVQIIDSGSVTYTIFDPSTGVNAPEFVTNFDPNQPNSYGVIYQTQNLPVGLTSTNTVVSLVLTWEGGSGVPGGLNPTNEILGIQISGGAYNGSTAATDTVCYGGSTFTYSLFCANSRTESVGWVIPPGNYNLPGGQSICGSVAANFNIPNTSLLQFQALISVIAPLTAQINQGVDTVNVYYQSPGSFNSNILVPQAVFLTAYNNVAYSGGGWNVWSGSAWTTANAGIGLSFIAQGYNTTINPAKYAPDAYVVPIPTGAYVYTSNGRLYVGGVTNNQVWYSDLNNYYRFETQNRFIQPNNPDQTSAGWDNFPSEVVTGIAKIGGSYIGVDPIIIFTNASIYRIDGISTASLSHPTRLAVHGMPFGNSFTEYLGDLYWVDEEKQVTVMGGGTPDQISRHKVDDKLSTANLTNVSLAVMNNRVHIAYTPLGASNQQNILVYETFYENWCEDIYGGSIVMQTLLTVDEFAGRKIYGLDNGGLVYNLEASGQTTDAGTAISMNIVGPMWHQGFFFRVRCEHLGIICDASNNILTVTRTWMGASQNGLVTNNGDGTINLNTAPSTPAHLQEWFDPSSTGTPVKPGGSGAGVQPAISGTMPGGNRIYGLYMAYEPTQVALVAQSTA